MKSDITQRVRCSSRRKWEHKATQGLWSREEFGEKWRSEDGAYDVERFAYYFIAHKEGATLIVPSPSSHLTKTHSSFMKTSAPSNADSIKKKS